MEVVFHEEKISLKDLFLWDKNARFPDKYFDSSEAELIKYFCEKQGKRDFKIIDLAEDIVSSFDLPQLEKFVVCDLDGKNIVLEGNRRLTAYKLLSDPELAPTAKLKEKFLVLKSKINIDENFRIECLVTESEAEGFRYIERKHLKGNNEVSWGEQERTHHKKRRGNATRKEEFKSAIARIIHGLDIPEEMKEQILGPGYVTNFWRIIDSSPSWNEFGFELQDDGELLVKDKDFKKKLKVIILNVLQKKDFSGNVIDSRSLNKNEEKELYLKSISEDDYKKVNEKIEVNTSTNLFDQKSTDVTASTKKTKPNPKSTSRSHLIPKGCCLIIGENKINNIYRELRDDLLLDDSKAAVPNAVGVLFRVFLEVSLDYYAKKNGGHCFGKNDTINIKIAWVVDDMTRKGCNPKVFNNINKVGSSSKTQSYLSIENFHEYVHSATVQPTSSELKAKWDNLEEFFVSLWGFLKSKK